MKILSDTDRADCRAVVLAGMELDRARNANPEPFNSPHEGYAVILEEIDELWEEVRKNRSKRDLHLMRAEALQVAAMALRFVTDCTKLATEPDTTTEHQASRMEYQR